MVEMRKEVPVRDTSQLVIKERSCSVTKQPSVTRNTENSKKRYFPFDNFELGWGGGSQLDLRESDQVAVRLKTTARKALMFK